MKIKRYTACIAGLLLLAAAVAQAQTPPAKAETAPAAKTEPAKTEPAKPAAKTAEPAKSAAPVSQPTSLPSGMPDIKPPAAPEGTGDFASLLKSILTAGKEGKWALLVGLVIMFLTRVVDWVIALFFKKKINQKVLPWIAIGLGVAGQVAFQLAAGGAWLDAILGGVSLGVGAAGTYSAFGRYLPAMKPKA